MKGSLKKQLKSWKLENIAHTFHHTIGYSIVKLDDDIVIDRHSKNIYLIKMNVSHIAIIEYYYGM